MLHYRSLNRPCRSSAIVPNRLPQLIVRRGCNLGVFVNDIRDALRGDIGCYSQSSEIHDNGAVIFVGAHFWLPAQFIEECLHWQEGVLVYKAGRVRIPMYTNWTRRKGQQPFRPFEPEGSVTVKRHPPRTRREAKQVDNRQVFETDRSWQIVIGTSSSFIRQW